MESVNSVTTGVWGTTAWHQRVSLETQLHQDFVFLFKLVIILQWFRVMALLAVFYICLCVYMLCFLAIEPNSTIVSGKVTRGTLLVPGICRLVMCSSASYELATCNVFPVLKTQGSWRSLGPRIAGCVKLYCFVHPVSRLASSQPDKLIDFLGRSTIKIMIIARKQWCCVQVWRLRQKKRSQRDCRRSFFVQFLPFSWSLRAMTTFCIISTVSGHINTSTDSNHFL